MEAKVKTIEACLASGWRIVGNRLVKGETSLHLNEQSVAYKFGQVVTFDEDNMEDESIEIEDDNGDSEYFPAEILLIKKPVVMLSIDDDGANDIKVFDDGTVKIRSVEIGADKAITMAQKILHANKKPRQTQV